VEQRVVLPELISVVVVDYLVEPGAEVLDLPAVSMPVAVVVLLPIKIIYQLQRAVHIL
jgi:hypothetical protein